MAYSVEAALQSGVFDTVMVSTDDGEIARIAEQYGAAVPFFRSEGTSNDYATTAQVLEEVLGEYAKRGMQFQQICCIYPTAPFITPARIRQAMELLEESDADSVLPVVRFSFPPQRGVILDNKYLRYKWPEHGNARSQDLEPIFHDVGQFYCVRTESFERQQTLVMEKTVPLILSEMEIQDIDTEEDWRLAEVKFRLLREWQGDSQHT